jgi:hypothetical protein
MAFAGVLSIVMNEINILGMDQNGRMESTGVAR